MGTDLVGPQCQLIEGSMDAQTCYCLEEKLEWRLGM